MYISKVAIRNFRVFDDIGIVATFKKGVNAIIGENNSGKTALIDAIRIAFSSVPYKKDIYFNKSDFHINTKGEVAKTAQIDVYFDEVSEDLFEIWDPENPTKGEFHVRYYTVPGKNGLEKIRYTAWGGPVEGNTLSVETFDALEVVFLGALRDAESELKPSRSSKLANLLGTVADSDIARQELIDILIKANAELLKKTAITKTREIINTNLAMIEQEVMQQRIDIGLIEPRFESIASSLRTWLKPRWFFIDKDNDIYTNIIEICSKEGNQKLIEQCVEGVYLDIQGFLRLDEPIETKTEEALTNLASHSLELYQNGLGYNNILFMSAVLGDMGYSKGNIVYNLLIVEEPEAHLHPQLQELVHSFFENKQQPSPSIQVFYTSHSPTLVSRIGIDKINLLFEKDHRIQCTPLAEANLKGNEKEYLERYLDVTKSQMFFAKGIIFVEGICEALLLPEMAKLLSRPLDKYAVEVVNVDGVSFKPFAHLFTKSDSSVCAFAKTALITDDDRCTDKEDKDTYISKDYDYDTDKLDEVIKKLSIGKPSSRCTEICSVCEATHIQPFTAKKTLEYELALSPNNVPFILNAIIEAYPQVGPKLSERVASLNTDEERAACIWLFIQTRNKSKGSFAQALSKIIRDQVEKLAENIEVEKKFCVPLYIRKAIYAVTEEEDSVDEEIDT